MADGEPGERWADRKVEEMDRKEAARTLTRRIDPDKLSRGEPLVVLRPGVVRDYDGDELHGNVESVEQLAEMVRYFETVQRPTGELPLIDFNHMAVGSMSIFATPEAALPLGAVLEMRVVEDEVGPGLEVVPGWTRYGRDYMDRAEGLLYPSATYRLAPTTDRLNAEPAAGAALLAFAVTPTPATRVDQLGALRSLLAGVAPSARQPADTDAPVAAAPPADAEEVPMMGMDEILAAIEALPPEEQAALHKKLMPDEPAPEAARAEAPAVAEAAAADPVAEARSLAAADVVDAWIAAGRLKPAQRSVWVRAYMADPEGTRKAVPEAATRPPAGDARRSDPAHQEIPSERNAFTAYARNLGGGDLAKGLAEVKRTNLAAYKAVYGRAPAARRGA